MATLAQRRYRQTLKGIATNNRYRAKPRAKLIKNVREAARRTVSERDRIVLRLAHALMILEWNG